MFLITDAHFFLLRQNLFALERKVFRYLLLPAPVSLQSLRITCIVYILYNIISNNTQYHTIGDNTMQYQTTCHFLFCHSCLHFCILFERSRLFKRVWGKHFQGEGAISQGGVNAGVRTTPGSGKKLPGEELYCSGINPATTSETQFANNAHWQYIRWLIGGSEVRSVFPHSLQSKCEMPLYGVLW